MADSFASTLARPGRRALLAAALAATAAGCSPVALVNRLVPRDTHRRETDVAYGPLARQRLDVYVPAGPVRDAPAIAFFYGGSWRSGQRGNYLFVGEALASCGFVAVVADYRLYPDVRFPAFLEDSALAVRWLHANATRLGASPDRIHVMGHSAGAYNAAMLAYDPRYLAVAGAPPQLVRGFIGLAGPYDFLPLESKSLQAIFGFPDTSPATQPINFVHPGAPRTLLVTARLDTTVSPGNSERLARRLRAADVPVTERRYDDLDHRTVVGALAAPLRGLAPVLDDVADFVKAAPTSS